MNPSRKVRLDLMTAKEVAAYLRRSDLAILPVGPTEFHGPRVPLGADVLQDTAMALMLAEEWDCVCLPPISYVYGGASEHWPGTISISPEESIAYVKAVAKSALAAGFHRLVLCASHGPMGFMAETVIRSIFRETGEVVLFLSPYARMVEELQRDFGRGSEDLSTLGAVTFLGLEGCFDPHVERDEPEALPHENLVRLRPFGGRLPWLFNADHQHTGLRSDIRADDGPRAAAAIRRAAAAMREVPALYDEYRRFLLRQMEEKPWEGDDIWSA
jgi:hypothetical protein